MVVLESFQFQDVKTVDMLYVISILNILIDGFQLKTISHCVSVALIRLFELTQTIHTLSINEQ